jgi:hypothetical protein
MAAMVVLTTALLAAEAASGAATQRPPRIAIAILPHGTSPAELAEVDGMAIGLLSAGIGSVPPAQTWIDIGQGARLNESLYDEGLPRLYVDPGVGGAPPHVPPSVWQRVRDRAQAAPADLVPGLLGATLRRGGVSSAAHHPVEQSAAILVGAKGAILEGRGCRQRPCARVAVLAAGLGRLRALTARLAAGDLVIAIERPPPDPHRPLAIGVAGEGFRGTLSSDSTRMRGYALSTDVAPTILERRGLSIPSQMSGEPIEATGELDPGFVERLEDRLAAVGPRRGPVIGASLLIWAGLALLAALAWRPRGPRVALPLLAVAAAYLPAVLLLTSALQPSELAERLVVGVGAPALAAVTLRLAPPFGALAIAGAVSVLGHAVDVVAGSPLTALSLMGPNPAAGARFFGIGNELEATLVALVPIATGAALVAWAPRISPRGAALAFALTGFVALGAFAPGRFGADVGAAIGIPIAAAVAAASCLSGSRRGLILVVAAPLVALAALGAADLILGGNAHLTRSVLEAGGSDQLADVAERRLRLSAGSFGRYADTPLLWACALLIAAGIAQRRRVAAWFRGRSTAWAGLAGAAAATVAGTLANDSGALVLMIGTAFCALTAGLAWATQRPA